MIGWPSRHERALAFVRKVATHDKGEWGGVRILRQWTQERGYTHALCEAGTWQGGRFVVSMAVPCRLRDAPRAWMQVWHPTTPPRDLAELLAGIKRQAEWVEVCTDRRGWRRP